MHSLLRIPILRLHVATAGRLRQLTRRLTPRLTRSLVRPSASDRGDSPVPTAIIIAGLAVIAIGVLAWLVTYVEGFMSDAPTELPDGPEGPG